ncbi:hypothetical protein ACEWY4_025161 [Coilia grayii]|uniref:NACHT domain-containing protein n=1 Tax=Coilia grayii TaxID=363190 RepID=A0ABD1IWR8_9TELE
MSYNNQLTMFILVTQASERCHSVTNNTSLFRLAGAPKDTVEKEEDEEDREEGEEEHCSSVEERKARQGRAFLQQILLRKYPVNLCYQSRVMEKRPGSPTHSSVSMKSDGSYDHGRPNFREGELPSDPRAMEKRPGSPTHSSVSMKSDGSYDHGRPQFREGELPSDQRVMEKRPGSPTHSRVSMKSDGSYDYGRPDFREGDIPSDPRAMEKRPGSPTHSRVSMKSDGSYDYGRPNFREGEIPSDPRVMEKRPGSPTHSRASIKSDGSYDYGRPNFREGEIPSDPRKQRRSQEADSSGQNEQQDLTHVFQMLENKIIAFVKNELQRFKMILSPDYQENFERKQVDENNAQDGALKMALHFLLKMEKKDLADKLRENELDVLCQTELKRNLQNKYQSVFEGIPKQGSSALLEKIYTEIYITEGGSGKVNEEHEVRQIESRSKRPAGQGKQIKCCDIFKPLPGEDKPSRRVMTKGVAGIGKTISIQKYILDWAEEKDNKEIHFIFPLPFRELNLMREKQHSLMDLLHHFFPELKQLSFGSQEKYKVLFIFDGLDECRLQLNFQKNESWTDVTGVTSLDVLLTNLIKGNLLPSALLWITSRPAAASQIPPEFVDLVTEIQGFNDSQKEEYFRKRVNDESLASRIISHIASSRSLHIMCYIPVFCWITACVLAVILSHSGGNQLPKTLTEMYTYFLIFQTKQKSQKFDNVYNLEPQWNRSLILDLGKLAYEQLEKGNLIFYEEDLRECGIDVTEAAVRSGICTQIFREEAGIFQATVYCFVHLSIQEYLAALYVFLMMAVQVTDVLSRPQAPSGEESMTTLHKSAVDKALEYKDGRFDLFLRFLLGLSLEFNQTLLRGLLQRGQKQTSNDETISYIKDKIREAPSSERVINLFHCLNELNDHSLVEEIQSFLNAGTLSEAKLSPGQWSALVFVLLTSDQKLDVFDLKKYVRSDEGLLRLKPVVEESQTLLLDSCRLSEMSCTTLASVLCKASSKVNKLDLSDNSIGDVGVQELCNGLKNPNCALESLRLSDCGVTGEGYAALSSALKSNPSHLEELDLRGNDPGDSGVKLLTDVLQDPDCKLQTLRLLKSDAADEACVYLTSVLGTNPLLLTEVKLSKKIAGDSGVKQICALLEDSHCKIKKLKLSGCSITGEGCAALSSALTSNPSHLIELNLNYNKLGDSGVKEISALLRNPDCKLQTLWLWSCSITGESCAALASALTSNPSHLIELNLSYNELGDSGVKQISALLRNPDCKLQTLGLESCSITEEGCAALTSALASNPSHLIQLNLRHNKLGDSGVKQISALLRNPDCKLQKLWLKSCGITEEGCAALTSALASNPSHLTELNLSWNKLGDSGVKQISALLKDPNYKLKTLHLDGTEAEAKADSCSIS